MAYKDKDKQKEANRAASQRRRDKAKGMTIEGMTKSGYDAGKGMTIVCDTKQKALHNEGVTYGMGEGVTSANCYATCSDSLLEQKLGQNNSDTNSDKVGQNKSDKVGQNNSDNSDKPNSDNSDKPKSDTNSDNVWQNDPDKPDRFGQITSGNKLLKSWASGEGTEFQRRLGRQAISYTLTQYGMAKALKKWGKTAVDSVRLGKVK